MTWLTISWNVIVKNTNKEKRLGFVRRSIFLN